MRAHDTQESDHQESFEPDVVYISTSEWLAIFTRHVDEVLGITPEEFVRRYRAGEYEEYNPQISLISASIPFYESLRAV
ncbi:MAG: hypothetical protein QM753_01710 [Thermomicrobiales bacterium]